MAQLLTWPRKVSAAGTQVTRTGGIADVAGRRAPGYCRLVNALGPGAGALDGGMGRDPPDQAWLGQLAGEQAALRAGLNPSVRAEVVHSSERTRITRLFLPGRTVIRKGSLGPDADRRVRHEVAMLERLPGVAGVAQLAGAPRYPGSVVLEDAGGASLAGMTKPQPGGELAALGLGLARAVAGMHQRGVIHRDITPANVVVADDGTPCLVDFALASSFAEIRPEFTHHAEIMGTLAYLAPEATGRPEAGGSAGRPVRAGRGAVRAGHGRAPLWVRGSAAADPRSPGPDPVPQADVNQAPPDRCPRSLHCWRRNRTTGTRPRMA